MGKSKTETEDSKDLDSMDTLVNAIGGWGKFQLILVTFTFSLKIPAAWGMLLMSFGNYHEGWQCPEADASGGAQNRSDQLHISTNPPPMRDRENNLSTARTPVNMGNPWSVQNYSVNASESSRSELSCTVYTQCPSPIVFNTNTSSTIVSEYGLLCDKAWIQSVIISIQMAGVFFGCYLSGYFGDRFGRKVSLYSSLALHALVNFIAVFSVCWEMYAALRFLIGLAVGGILTGAFLYPMEFVSHSWRAVVTGIPVWNIGSASFSVAVLILKDWKHIHIATSVFSLISLIPVFWVPESMRWLAVHDKVEQAKKVAIRIARVNGRPVPNTSILEVIASKEREKMTGKGRQYSYIDLFASWRVLKITLVIGVVWCTQAVVYYAIIFGIKALSGDFYINLIVFSITELAGMLFIIPASKKLGRRLASIVYFVLIAIACMSVTLVTFLAPEDIRNTATTILALLAKVHITAVWMIVSLHTSELYPTVVRNLSIGYANGCARIGGILAPYLIPTSSDILYVCFLVMGGLLLVCSALIMTLPETKGRPLEDLIQNKLDKSALAEKDIELEISNLTGKE